MQYFNHPFIHLFINYYLIKVICILGETLESLDDDGIIPAYGFGDRKTKDKGTFPLKGTVSHMSN